MLTIEMGHDAQKGKRLVERTCEVHFQSDTTSHEF